MEEVIWAAAAAVVALVPPVRRRFLPVSKAVLSASLGVAAAALRGVEGIVDFYLMPAFDDIARLYFSDDRWQLHHEFPGAPTVADIREAESRPLSKESFQSVLEAMIKNAA